MSIYFHPRLIPFIKAVLVQLRSKAQKVYSEYHTCGSVPAGLYTGNNEDELSLFGGQTRIIHTGSDAASDLTQNAKKNQPQPLATIPEVHPSVSEGYMGFFPASAFAPGFDFSGSIPTPSASQMVPMPSQLIGYSYPPSTIDEFAWPNQESLFKAAAERES